MNNAKTLPHVMYWHKIETMYELVRNYNFNIKISL
jgi:hypothetical protein